jgi:hypothetical protein
VKQAMKDNATVRATQNPLPSGEGAFRNPPLQGEVASVGGRWGITLSGDVSGFDVPSCDRDTPPSRKGAPPPLEGEDFNRDLVALPRRGGLI